MTAWHHYEGLLTNCLHYMAFRTSLLVMLEIWFLHLVGPFRKGNFSDFHKMFNKYSINMVLTVSSCNCLLDIQFFDTGTIWRSKLVFQTAWQVSWASLQTSCLHWHTGTGSRVWPWVCSFRCSCTLGSALKKVKINACNGNVSEQDH